MNSRNRPLVAVSRLVKRFYLRRPIMFGRRHKIVEALKGVSLNIAHGETAAVIGESGSGKSTLAKSVALLLNPDDGTISIDGVITNSLSTNQQIAIRQKIHLIFQDPYSSLNPRLNIRDIIMEPLIIHKKGKRHDRIQRVETALTEVGLHPANMSKFPHQFSGGQRQRIAIARAIIAKPELIIADEPLSALDVSIQSQIINLLMELRIKKGLTYLFISHDLSVVSHLSDRVIVMYKGQIVESGPTESVFSKPLHPYTRLLISTTPRLGKRKRTKSTRSAIEAEPELNTSYACTYYQNCRKTSEICRFVAPDHRSQNFLNPEHLVMCHFPGQARSNLEGFG